MRYIGADITAIEAEAMKATTAKRRARKAQPSVEGRLWFHKEGESFLGRGRVELLEKIGELGSISAAAREMGMSYKAAWDAVDAMNTLAEQPLVIRSTGGKHGGGTLLTEEGRRTVELFRHAEGEYRRFLSRLGEGIADFDRFYDLMRRFALKTTARNQFQGRIIYLTKGAVNTEVVVEVPGGDRLVAIAANESVECLKLAEGKEVYALIKESNVIVMPGDVPGKVSTRNKLCGVVARCIEGAVNGEVGIQLPGGRTVTAIITNESIRGLGLKEGAPACALIKATDVLLAVNE
jgi:molybdate transport system regulatory protein